MDNKHYNEHRYKRIKQRYRLLLGLQKLINYPFLNIVWILFVIGIIILGMYVNKYAYNISVYPLLKNILHICILFLMVISSIISFICVIQYFGYFFAAHDEADMELIFGDKRDIKNLTPILIYKKTDTKTKVTKREFYTTIPMERWQEKREAICDRMNIHIIGDITYGGKRKNKGNHIYFESSHGRISINRGVLYDDTF